jgi:hypothetical protein
MTDWLTGWVTGTDWLSDRHWLAEWLTDWVTEWQTGWLVGWLVDWLIDWLTDWLTLTEWLTAWWLTGWITEWRTDWLADTDWMADYLSDLLAGWLIDWLADWLNDSVERTSCWETHGSLFGQEISLIFYSQISLSRFKQLATAAHSEADWSSFPFNSYFNIIIPSTALSSKWRFQISSTKRCVHFCCSFCPSAAHEYLESKRLDVKNKMKIFTFPRYINADWVL